MATRDERTRPWHGDADGQRVKPEESFKVGGEKMRFPGDPWGSGMNTYNCRCTMVSYFPEFPDEKPRQTYAEWYEEKKNFTFEKENVIIQYRKSNIDSKFRQISDGMFNKLVSGVKKQGAFVIRGGEEANRLLGDARAGIIGDILVFKDDVCKTDVYEKIRHFHQNKIGMNQEKDALIKDTLNEIDAKEYLIKNAKKLKIPRIETEETKKELEYYKDKLRKENGS